MNRIERSMLEEIAREAMLYRGFLPDFPPAARAQADTIDEAALAGQDGVRDLCDLPWSSIDNPESRDLDQIEVVSEQAAGTRLIVGVADVNTAVPVGSPIDRYAANNTTSVYTGVHTYTMLPTRLSFDMTSLLPERPRRVTAVDMLITPEGELSTFSLYPALALNRAKLNYPAISTWLDGGPMPWVLGENPEVRRQIEAQDALASRLAHARKRAGSLDLDTAEMRPVLDEHGEVINLEAQHKDRAGSIVEEFMIATNRAVVQALDRAGLPSILRVVRTPAHWDLIVTYAGERGATLPDQPDSAALSAFLDRMRREQPESYHEISLAIVKLIGRGEYVAHEPGQKPVGHFGLATEQYGHATAPNRRFADLATQRLLAPLLLNAKAPYSPEDVDAIARRCSHMEAEADKIERRVRKSIAAALLAHRTGERFRGIITKSNGKDVYVHIFHPPVEGMVVRGGSGLSVGDRVEVRLLRVDIRQSFIDFTVA